MSEMPWINPIIKDKDGPWVAYTDYAALEASLKDLEAERNQLKVNVQKILESRAEASLEIIEQAELIARVQASLKEADERVVELLAEVNLLKAALSVCADSDSILRRQEIKNKALGGGE
jgi:chromosome segregation ATPase